MSFEGRFGTQILLVLSPDTLLARDSASLQETPRFIDTFKNKLVITIEGRDNLQELDSQVSPPRKPSKSPGLTEHPGYRFDERKLVLCVGLGN
jgi:hypothetical protein